MRKNSNSAELADRLMRLHALSLERGDDFRLRLETILDLVENDNDFISALLKPEGSIELLKTRVQKKFFEEKRGQIAVIGYSRMKKEQIYGIGKSFGISEPKDHFELNLCYQGVKMHLHPEKFMNGKYLGVILGPIPHMIQGMEGYGNIENMLSAEGFPPLVRAETQSTGSDLKITKSSFSRALRHLLMKVC